MSLYVESSAVLAWILGEPSASDCEHLLSTADAVYASEMTLVQCDRALYRGVQLGEIQEADAERWRGQMARAAAHWMLLAVSEEVMTRARRSFPYEPVRTLDAIHLSSALLARTAAPDVRLLSLDDRVRRNGLALGLEPAP